MKKHLTTDAFSVDILDFGGRGLLVGNICTYYVHTVIGSILCTTYTSRTVLMT